LSSRRGALRDRDYGMANAISIHASAASFDRAGSIESDLHDAARHPSGRSAFATSEGHGSAKSRE